MKAAVAVLFFGGLFGYPLWDLGMDLMGDPDGWWARILAPLVAIAAFFAAAYVFVIGPIMLLAWLAEG